MNITFKADNLGFSHRTAGVAIHEDHVLLMHALSADFWIVPGGRVDVLETSEQSLIREMQEELSTEVKIERLLWMVENLFEYQRQYWHELATYYLVTLPEGSLLLEQDEFIGDENGFDALYRWHPLSTLADLTIYPTFLKETLLDLPETPQHIIHNTLHNGK